MQPFEHLAKALIEQDGGDLAAASEVSKEAERTGFHEANHTGRMTTEAGQPILRASGTKRKQAEQMLGLPERVRRQRGLPERC
jgi:hypothetical protein